MLHTRAFVIQALLAGAVALSITGLSTVALADAAKETATAAQHAGLASGATAIAQVHMHLHHAVNCLVGPKGDAFDAKEANPCTGQGDGAIPDTTDAAGKAKLMAAVTKAQAGIKSDDLAVAQKAAADTAAALK